MPNTILTLVITLFVLTACLAAVAEPMPGFVDLEKATVVIPPNLTGPENKAVLMLVEEVEKRTQIRWPITHNLPAGPAIVVGPVSAFSMLMPEEAPALQRSPVAHKPEAYQLRVSSHQEGNLRVLVAGTDARGVLFGGRPIAAQPPYGKAAHYALE